MIDVYFYNFDKRLNSTALPPISSATHYQCVLKDDTSILTPTLKLRLSTKPTYNYFKFYNRFYWVTDIVSMANNMWAISGRVDVLGTFRLHIRQTSAFVLYDSTANTQIPDGRLAVETDVETNTSTASMPWSFSSGEGTYIIATTGCKDSYSWNDGNYYAQSDTREGTGVYTIPYSSLQQIGFDAADITTDLASFYQGFNQDMADDLAIMNAQTSDLIERIGNIVKGEALMIKDTLQYTFNFWKLIAENVFGGGNALQNVKAAYWLPFVVPGSATTPVSRPLALGTYKDYVTGLERVDDAIITSLWINVSIPWQFSDWRNASCTEVMLYIPMIGCINIPSDVVKGHDTLQVRLALNLYSGAMSCEVRCDGGALGTYGANVAMPYMIGDSNANIAAITNTVTNAISKNYMGAVLNGMNAFGEMATSVGGIGGGAGSGLTSDIVCVVRFHDTSQEPSALIGTIGTPTHQLKTLSGSGYCQCMGAQLNCGYIESEPYPTRSEIEEVNTYLNTGVYLE
jgi:hypothetical protein